MSGIVLKIEKPAQGGKGLARLQDGRVCFVEGALPGELVEARFTKEKKDFAEALCLRVLEASPGRVRPQCPLYGKCGGCNLQHASPALQTQMARTVLQDLFARIAKIELPENVKIVTGAPGEEWGYRFRAKLHPCAAGWGLLGRNSHQVFPVKHCPVFCEKLNAVLHRGFGYAQPPDIERSRNGRNARLFFSNETEAYLGRHIAADSSVFFQSNLKLLPRLIEAVRLAAGCGDILVDLFSGVGLFGAFLQGHFDRVLAVERDPNCVRFARQNLGKNAEFVSAPAEEWIVGQDFSRTVLVVDPPRTGLPAGATAALQKNRPRTLIYVSCDMATLARDARLLIGSGYSLKSLEGFAFYPQTSHLEGVAVFGE
jgi:23S rRNA (uracil1939-C5)-methyltransferase